MKIAEKTAFASINKVALAYDLSSFKKIHFEIKPKDAAISLKLPAERLAAVKIKAKKEGIPYNRLIRKALEREIKEVG